MPLLSVRSKEQKDLFSKEKVYKSINRGKREV